MRTRTLSQRIRAALRASSLLLILVVLREASAQFEAGTPQYLEWIEDATEAAELELEMSEELKPEFHPGTLVESIDEYTYEEPRSVDFEVGLIVDPCRQHMEANTDPEGRILGGWDCCVNVFGTPEFGQSRLFEGDDERRIEKIPLSPLTEISVNVNPIFEDLSAVNNLNSRRADDETFLAPECNGVRDPFTYCQGLRLGVRRFSLYSNCTDNNETVFADRSCLDHNGNPSPFCMQIAYSQTAYSMICNNEFTNDDHCGTFFEIHIPDGTVYNDEEFVISQSKLLDRDTSGYNTTIIPLTYGNYSDRILCEYNEEYIRVGSLVYIESSAERCCCPHLYTDALFTGMFFCPINKFQDFDVDGFKGGPFAAKIDDLDEFLLDDEMIDTFPYCPYVAEDKDELYCGRMTDEFESYSGSTRKYGRAGRSKVVSATNRGNRFFVRKCPDAYRNMTTGQVGSEELTGTYRFQCPYFKGCAKPGGSQPCVKSDEMAELDDFEFSFTGFVGKVVYVPEEADVLGRYLVTFNDGRTAYPFPKEDLRLEKRPSNYEMWWVQRTKYNFIIRKKKPFRVSEPTCTFDNVNDRYFPWAVVLDHTNPNCALCSHGKVPCTADYWPLDMVDAIECIIGGPEVETTHPTITPLP